MSWGTALGIAGLVSNIFASDKASSATQDAANVNAAATAAAGAANAKISRYDALVAREDALFQETATGLEVSDFLKQANALVGTQRAGYGKAGVALTGSAKTVIGETIKESARRAEIIRFNGLTAAEAKRSLAKRYDMLAESGLRDAAAQSFSIARAGAAEANAIKIKGLADTMSGLYKMSEGGAFG